MWSAAILAVWLVVQPWFVWPALHQDVSQRLTLVCCCVALGLLRFGDVTPQTPLPRGVGWWVAILLGVMTSHHWHLLSDGGYFQFFQETALFADGLLVVIALIWGLWALQQLPRAWFGRLRWVGLGMCTLNLLFAVAQAQGLNWHLGTPQLTDVAASDVARYGFNLYKPSGVMGYDRSLGAYAVLWLPILWTWRRWMALIPLACIVLASKVTAWIGVAVVVWWLCPGWKWKVLGILMALGAAVWWSDGELVKKIPMRLLTWWHTLQGVQAYWVRGVGFSPMTSTMVRQQFGYALPGLHSDWLSLAFHAGAVVTAWAAGWMVWLAHRRPRTPMAKALQASLVAIAVMSVGQSVVSRPSVAGILLILLAWFWSEQEGVMG